MKKHKMGDRTMIISERIFQLLKEKGISQKAFSDRTGIAQSTISDWKRKKTNPAADKILIICEVLGITPDELLSGADCMGEDQMGYIRVGKETEEYVLVEQYRSLNTSDKGRLFGYLQAMKEIKKE